MRSFDHVVIATDFGYVNGGVSQVAITSAKELAKRGIQVTYFSSVEPVDPSLPGPNIRVISLAQRDLLQHTNPLTAIPQFIWNRRVEAFMAEALVGLDPRRTIVHVHSWAQALSSNVFLGPIRQGFRLVTTLHDYFIACPNGGFLDYRSNQVCKLRPLSLPCLAKNCETKGYLYKIVKVLRQWIQKKVVKVPERLKNIIYVSDFSRRILQPYLPSNVRAFPLKNPIDVLKGSPVDVRCNQAFYYVGRLSREKGVVLFAEAAARLNIPAVFVGKGICEQEIRKTNPKAKLLGWMDRAATISALRESKALIFPSVWPETQGLVVAEAAAMGIPALVSSEIAATEQIRDGETGLVFERGNVEDLCRKIRMLEDADFTERLGRQAFDQYWRSPTTLGKHVDELMDIYDQVGA